MRMMEIIKWFNGVYKYILLLTHYTRTIVEKTLMNKCFRINKQRLVYTYGTS